MIRFRTLQIIAVVVGALALAACAPTVQYEGPLTRGQLPRSIERIGAGAPLSRPNPTRVPFEIAWSEVPDLSGSYEGEVGELTSFTYVGPARLELARHPAGGYVGRLDYANPHYAWTVFHNTNPSESEYASFSVVVPPQAGVYPDGAVVIGMRMQAGPEQRSSVRANEWYQMFVKLRPMPTGGYALQDGVPGRFSPELLMDIDRMRGGLPEARLRFDFWATGD